MAVLKSNRNESQLQFLDTARDLEIFTLRNCVKFPKRYTFFITTEIVRLSQSVFNNVKAANSIFPSGELEVQLRRDYLTKANCDLQCLISQLDVAKEMFGEEVKSNTWCSWMDLIEKEAKLISAVKKKIKNVLRSQLRIHKAIFYTWVISRKTFVVACNWWLRSPYYNNSNNFCYVNSNGNSNNNNANNSYGVAFGFCTIMPDIVIPIEERNQCEYKRGV